MLSKYGIFCILLLLVVIFLAINSYQTWTQPIELPLGKGVEKKTETEAKTEISPSVGSTREPPSVDSYILIAEKNIFRPERKEFPIPASVGTKKPLARPLIVLYGVTIQGDYQSASIVNPGRPLRKGERETITLKQGDQVGEYKLAKILPDRITLEAAEDSFEVLLYDLKTPKKRSEIKTESKPATITSTSPTPAAKPAEAPKATPPPAVAVEKPRELPAPVTPSPPSYTPRRGRPITPPATVPAPTPAPTKEGGS